MSDRTTADETMTRDELASYLSTLAQEFDSDTEEIDIMVGNKTVSLSPSENVNVSVDVVERSSMLRGNQETVAIELNWKP